MNYVIITVSYAFIYMYRDPCARHLDLNRHPARAVRMLADGCRLELGPANGPSHGQPGRSTSNDDQPKTLFD